MYTLQIASTDLDATLTFAKLSYLGIGTAPILFAIFTIIYAGYDNWLTRRNLILMGIWPALVITLVLTNDLHQLHWIDWTMAEQPNGVQLFETERGASYWLYALYVYTAMMGALYLLLRISNRTDKLHRAEARLLLGATVAIWGVNFIFITGLSPLPGYDFTTLAFALIGLVIGYLVEQRDIFSSPPLMRDLIMDNLEHGMIVIDTEERVVEINRKAKTLLDVKAGSGKKVEDLFAPYPQVLDLYQHLQTVPDGDPLERREEDKLRDDPETFIEMRIARLTGGTGQDIGNLITLQDITQRKQAQVAAAQRFGELTALRHIDNRMTSTLDINEVLDTALKSAMTMSGADAAMIVLIESQDSDPIYRVAHIAGDYPDDVKGFVFEPDIGITGEVLRDGKPLLIHDVSLYKSYRAFCEDTVAQITVPLRVKETLIGALTLESAKRDSFNRDNFAFVGNLADRMAVALENARLYAESRTKVDELRGLNDQLKELETLKTDMIRMASHDLRNPLGTLIGYLDLLEMDKVNLIPQHQTYVETMLRLAERTQNIINDILSLERLEEAESTMRVVNLTKLMTKVMQRHQDDIAQKQMAVSDHISDDVIRVWGDPAQLTEALSNLLENALKYTPAQGHIAVKLCVHEDRAVFKVVDNGYGIAEDQQERLFEPFYRAVRDETRAIEGTGLGLHLVKNIVRRHQGTLQFSSMEGEGSTFGFELPLMPV